MTASEEDWEILGVEPGSDIAKIKKAYRERRALYEPAALATYSLLDDEERTDIVAKIDAAYRRVLDDKPEQVPSEPPAAPASPKIETPMGPPPEPAEHPGGHLRHHRLKRGISLQEIATETKIGIVILEQIEAEDFDSLPAPVFVRGHVQQFAREIGIDDSDELARLYVDKMTGGEDEEED